MNALESFSAIEPLKPSAENLTAILTCLGAKTSAADRDYILARQNPFRQKRGMGLGAYAVVQLPGGGRRPRSGGGSNFSNINIYTTQAQTSPLTLRITEPESGTFALVDAEGTPFTQGTVLPVPAWGRQQLSTGKPAITVLQQHGPANLVGVLGAPSCELFENGNACRFCMLNCGATNDDRSVEEIIEAFGLARQDRKAYNLTLTTGLQISLRDVAKTVEAIAKVKRGLGGAALALEMAPFPEDGRTRMQELKDAGLDTLMMPLDCASEVAQQQYVPGKAALLQRSYWENVTDGVKIFGQGNLTSNILVGLEPLEETLRAMDRMLELGVIPEPLPVRWDDSKLLNGEPLPLTDPRFLIKARTFIADYIQKNGLRETIQRTRAGCAACGGCGGIVVNNLPSLNPITSRVPS